MEWSMPVNDMLYDEITKITHTLLPPAFRGDIWKVRMMQESLAREVDSLGAQSAAAQGLKKCITTAAKLRAAPAHSLYLLKDAAAAGGRGEVIGLLKVGRKQLFLWDEAARSRVMEPLCVLDFFVRADRQRAGCGRKLFDHMLRDTGAKPEELAIDGPSPKIIQFLAKNYKIDRLIHQSNNFSVSSQIFQKADSISPTPGNGGVAGVVAAAGAGAGAGAATPAAVGRYAAAQPPSAIASVIHSGGYPEHDVGRSGRSSPWPASPMPPTPPSAAPPTPPSAAPPTPPSAVPAPRPPSAVSVPTPPTSGVGERPCTLAVSTAEPPPPRSPAQSPEPPRSATRSPSRSPNRSPNDRRDSQLTDRGYFDIKFYHNKLW